MKLLKGEAGKVISTTEVSGDGREGGVSITYIAVFLLDGQQVKVCSSKPPMISESDIVSVAGKLSNGVFRAYAYKNITNGMSGNESIIMMFILGVISPVAGILGFLLFSGESLGVGPKIISFTFVSAGLYMLYKGARVLKALSLLKSEDRLV